jgi:DNA ligase 4
MDDIMGLIMGGNEEDSSSSIVPPSAVDSDVPVVESKRPDNCNEILFTDLCKMFEKVETTSSKASKLKIIFDKSLRQKVGAQSLFPMIRLLLPLNDPDRPKYGLKQSSIANTYIKALNLNKTSGDAQSLVHWKDPSKVSGAKASEVMSGDFGTILEHVLRNRAQKESSDATIGEVNKILDDLALADGQEAKAAVVRDQIRPRFCASEQKWLMRIVFQDLKIGLGHEAVLSAFSDNALQRYNECTNLRTVVEEEGGTGGVPTGIRPFVKFKPMLGLGFPKSSHGQVSAVESAMSGNPFLMDVKLDGERMMAHVMDGEVMLFTRNGTNYTDFYTVLGDIIKRNVTVKSCILDGEVMAWDSEKEAFIPFGANKGVGSGEREARDAVGGRAGWDRDLTCWLVYKVQDPQTRDFIF